MLYGGRNDVQCFVSIFHSRISIYILRDSWELVVGENKRLIVIQQTSSRGDSYRVKEFGASLFVVTVQGPTLGVATIGRLYCEEQT